MPISELQALRSENRALRAELSGAGRHRATASSQPPPARSTEDAPLLLRMAEGLIEAHRAAKVDADITTVELIADALFHVGRRLSREVGPVVRLPPI